MPEDKYKNIPTLDVPVLEDVVVPGKEKQEDQVQDGTRIDKPVSENTEKRDASDRRKQDRRKTKTAIPEDQPERRVEQRRNTTRREDDQRLKEELDILAEKIMQDMMPDLEQHLFMQLRFELQKYLPKILKQLKDEDNE
ncbi:MAG: hypothetical protein OEM07_00800 [Gammaproteobacteria bacterium]|nr:hypothetical protein [Gammaproteobacteria bacterium]